MFSQTTFGDADSSAIASAIRSVPLFHLRRLDFREIPIRRVVAMLRWFDIDKRQPLSLSIRAAQSEGTGVSEEALPLLQDLVTLNPYGILDNLTKLRVALRAGKCSLYLINAERDLKLECFSKGPVLSRLFGQKLRQLDELWVSSSSGLRDSLNATIIRDLLEVAGSVRKLYVNVDFATLRPFWEALEDCCPSLQELHVLLHRIPRETKDMNRAYALDSLYEALETRAARGVPPLAHLGLYLHEYDNIEPSVAATLNARRMHLIQRAQLPHVTKVTADVLLVSDAEMWIRPPATKMPPIWCSSTTRDG